MTWGVSIGVIPLETVAPEENPSRSKADREVAKLPKGRRPNHAAEPRFRSNFAQKLFRS